MPPYASAVALSMFNGGGYFTPPVLDRLEPEGEAEEFIEPAQPDEGVKDAGYGGCLTEDRGDQVEVEEPHETPVYPPYQEQDRYQYVQRFHHATSSPLG